MTFGPILSFRLNMVMASIRKTDELTPADTGRQLLDILSIVSATMNMVVSTHIYKA